MIEAWLFTNLFLAITFSFYLYNPKENKLLIMFKACVITCFGLFFIIAQLYKLRNQSSDS